MSGTAVYPSLPHEPSHAPAHQPHGEPLWVQEPSGPPAPGEVSQDASIGGRGGFKSLQRCRAVSTAVGVAWTSCVCWLCGVQGGSLVLCPVSPAPEPCGCSPGGYKRRGPLPDAQQPPKVVQVGWCWFCRDPSWVSRCLHSFPAASLGLLWIFSQPMAFNMGSVTPPGMCRGTLSEVRKKRAGLPPHRDGARGGSSVGNKSELPRPFSVNGAARF